MLTVQFGTVKYAKNPTNLIRTQHNQLRVCRCKVLVLHSAMQSSDQKKVFNNYPRCRKVVSMGLSSMGMAVSCHGCLGMGFRN